MDHHHHHRDLFIYRGRYIITQRGWVGDGMGWDGYPLRGDRILMWNLPCERYMLGGRGNRSKEIIGKRNKMRAGSQLPG